MVVVMEPGANEEQIRRVMEKLDELGLDAHCAAGIPATILSTTGQPPNDGSEFVKVMPGVAEA